jgi:miniconductance mechanosensitive channel
VSGFSYQTIDHFFEQKLLHVGLSADTAQFFNVIVLCAILGVFAVLLKFLLHRIIMRTTKRWVERSDNNIGDILLEKGSFENLSHLAPALILLFLFPLPLSPYENAVAVTRTAAHIYFVGIIISTINSVIDLLHGIYDKIPSSTNRPINGYIQVSKFFIMAIGALLILSIIIKKDLSSLLAGLTAFAAALVFVFKDLILGIIAGIQISADDIVRVGDSIEMPGRNIEGKVIAITLNTVKILNSNKTISSIPSHAIVSESFQNWRGLDIAGGRRIKRAINLDVRSIGYIDEKFAARLKKNPHVVLFAEKIMLDINSDIQMTNLGAFRKYLDYFLRSLPDINSESLIQICHLQPTENGLPLQLFMYSRLSDYIRHEALQNQIFEHIFAIIPEFNLRVFQRFSADGAQFSDERNT